MSEKKMSWGVFRQGDAFATGKEAGSGEQKREERKVLEQAFDVFLVQYPDSTKAEMLAFIIAGLNVPFDIEKDMELLKLEQEGGAKIG